MQQRNKLIPHKSGLLNELKSHVALQAGSQDTWTFLTSDSHVTDSLRAEI
jgi:hypothetical protein